MIDTNIRFIPMKRTAPDGEVWWCVFDIQKENYSTLTCFGKYKTKAKCEYAINYAKEHYPFFLR